MKNFDDIEKLWRQQAISVPSDPRRARAAQVAVERDANRYGRLLKWGIFVVLFSIVVGQLFEVMNYLHATWPLTFGYVLQKIVSLVFQIGLLLVMLRRHRAHQSLLKRSAANVRENVVVALEVVELEMRHYRSDARFIPLCLLLASAPVIERFLSGHFDATGLAGRLLFILGLSAVLGLVAWRHYRRVLGPQKERLLELRRDLDEA